MQVYKHLLQEQGISVTSARVDILALLDKKHEPLTIEDLRKHLSSSVHQTTLYRSLKVLVEAGIVYQTDFRDGAAYFEYQGKNHHHHMVCTSCKKRVSVDLCIATEFPSIEKKTSFTITNHMLELFGLCEQCS